MSSSCGGSRYGDYAARPYKPSCVHLRRPNRELRNTVSYVSGHPVDSGGTVAERSLSGDNYTLRAKTVTYDGPFTHGNRWSIFTASITPEWTFLLIITTRYDQSLVTGEGTLPSRDGDAVTGNLSLVQWPKTPALGLGG